MSIENEFKSLMSKEELKEAFTPIKAPSAIEIVKELTNESWSRGKKLQREACKRMSELANSDDTVANNFLKEMDKASTKIGKNLLEKYMKETHKKSKKTSSDDENIEEKDKENVESKEEKLSMQDGDVEEKIPDNKLSVFFR